MITVDIITLIFIHNFSISLCTFILLRKQRNTLFLHSIRLSNTCEYYPSSWNFTLIVLAAAYALMKEFERLHVIYNHKLLHNEPHIISWTCIQITIWCGVPQDNPSKRLEYFTFYTVIKQWWICFYFISRESKGKLYKSRRRRVYIILKMFFTIQI